MDASADLGAKAKQSGANNRSVSGVFQN